MDIVAAVDLNTEPRAVVDAAARWAEHLHATLHLRTVSSLQWHPDEIFGTETQVLVGEWDRVRSAEVKAVRHLLERVPEALRGTAEVLEGPPAPAIAVAGLQADLVVCATHGRTGLTRLFLGSTCEAIVRTSSTPTLVLRLGALGAPDPTARADRILVPIDPRSPSASALAMVRRWFPEARITLAAVLDRQVRLADDAPIPETPTVLTHPDREWALRVLESLLAQVGADGRTQLLLDEAVGTGGCIAAAASRYDLVAMTSQRRYGVAHLWWGSVAEHVARLAPVPTLIVGAGSCHPAARLPDERGR